MARGGYSELRLLVCVTAVVCVAGCGPPDSGTITNQPPWTAPDASVSQPDGGDQGVDHGGNDNSVRDVLCASFDLLNGEILRPSVIKLYYQLSDCAGAPLDGIAANEFLIEEDGTAVSLFESDQDYSPEPRPFELATVLLLDMSGSILESGNLPGLREAARPFVQTVAQNRSVAIYTFDGRADMQRLLDFTSDVDAVGAAIDSLTDYVAVDESTNLNGAILQGIALLDAQVSLIDPDALSSGALIVFTDGTDQAARVSDADAVAVATGTAHSVYTIGLGGEVDPSHLEAIGKDGTYIADDADTLKEVFGSAASDIEAFSQSYYVLAYCSPKRAGEHTLELSLKGYEGAVQFGFDATGFAGGCSADDFLNDPADVGGGGDDVEGGEPFFDDNSMTLDIGSGVSMDLVAISAGSFMMGSDGGPSSEQPVHQVTIDREFYLGRYEITQAQWLVVMGTIPSPPPVCSTCPATVLSWQDAVEFCDTLSALTGIHVRLPTEAEWEYACRAGTTTAYSFGDDAGGLADHAWYRDDNIWTAQEVGGKLPNAWGVHDMHGNVWEWCEDPWHSAYDGAPTDGSAWASGPQTVARMVRGGSWFDADDKLRCAHRSAVEQVTRSASVGFRVVVEMP